MAYQLPRPLWQCSHQISQCCLVQSTGRRYTDGAVRCANLPGADFRLLQKAAFHPLCKSKLRCPCAATAGLRDGPGLLKGVANSRNPGANSRPEQGFEDERCEMRVLVGIKVGDLDALVLQESDLRYRLALDIQRIELVGKQRAKKGVKLWSKTNTVPAHQRRDEAWLADGHTIGEDDVATNAKRRPLLCQSHGILKRVPSSHQCR